MKILGISVLHEAARDRVVRLLYPQHVYRLPDDAVVARWVENPYSEHLTGQGGGSVLPTSSALNRRR